MKSRLILALLGAALATTVHAQPLTGTLKKIADSGAIELMENVIEGFATPMNDLRKA